MEPTSIPGGSPRRPAGPAAWSRGEFCPVVLAALLHDAGRPDPDLVERLVRRFAWEEGYARACVDAFRSTCARTGAAAASLAG